MPRKRRGLHSVFYTFHKYPLSPENTPTRNPRINGSPPNPEIQYWYYEDRNDYDDWLAVSPLNTFAWYLRNTADEAPREVRVLSSATLRSPGADPELSLTVIDKHGRITTRVPTDHQAAHGLYCQVEGSAIKSSGTVGCRRTYPKGQNFALPEPSPQHPQDIQP